jgi:glycine hydroxymethyltransferase
MTVQASPVPAGIDPAAAGIDPAPAEIDPAPAEIDPAPAEIDAAARSGIDAREVLGRSLRDADPQVFAAIGAELVRQESTLEMIASENFAPLSVMQAQGSVLTNKYAEGYPGRRYYGGCEHVDVIEQLAIDRVKDLFGAEYANVQPHSGAQANAAAMAALLKPGDTILGLDLSHGGHLTHGMRLNFSGQLYKVAAYHVRKDDHLVDMAEVERLAQEHRPQLIIAGWSAYPRHLDFAEFRRIADSVGAYLMVDMAHFAGLVATGLHPSPVPHAHVVTSTTHKTLGGPRGGIILAKDELRKKFNSSVFPGQQGGPLEHVIAAKAVAFKLAAEPAFAERQQRTLEGARIIADRLTAADSKAAGVDVVSGGTDVHLVLVDLRNSVLDGKQAEDRLHSVGITVNRNAVPFDPRPPLVSSGVRIGTPALAARGFGAAEFTEVAEIIAQALRPDAGEDDLDALRDRVTTLAARFPLYPELAQSALGTVR